MIDREAKNPSGVVTRFASKAKLLEQPNSVI